MKASQPFLPPSRVLFMACCLSMANHDSTIRLDFLDLWPDFSVMWERMGEPQDVPLTILGAATDAESDRTQGPGPPHWAPGSSPKLSRQGQGIKLSWCGESHGSNLLLMVAAARLGSERAPATLLGRSERAEYIRACGAWATPQDTARVGTCWLIRRLEPICSANTIDYFPSPSLVLKYSILIIDF